MTANELRIGNSFTYGKGENIDTVYQITFDRQDGHLVNGNIPVKDCSGIPLSPEVLESCGFREGTVEGFYYLDIGNDTFLVSGGEDVWVEKTVKDEDYSVALGGASNIHQLQNLYYVLCGEELPTTPKGQITK